MLLFVVIHEQEKKINPVGRNCKKSVIPCKLAGYDLKITFIFVRGANSKS